MAADAAALSNDASLCYRAGGSAIGLSCDLADLTKVTPPLANSSVCYNFGALKFGHL